MNFDQQTATPPPTARPAGGPPTNRRMYYWPVGMFATLMVLLWAAVGVYLFEDRVRTIESARINAANLSRVVAEQLAGTMRVADQTLLHFKHVYEKDPSGFDLATEFWSIPLPSDMLMELSYISADGYSSGPNIGTVTSPVYVGDREYFRANTAGDTGTMLISQPFLSRRTGRWTIPLARRLNRPDGSFAGELLLTLDPEYLQNFLHELNLGQHGFAAIVGLDMILRAGTFPGTSLGLKIGQNFAAFAVVPDLVQSPNGVYEGPSPPDNIDRIFSYRKLTNYPLVVVIGLARDDILADFYTKRRLTVSFSVVVSAIFLAAATVIIRRVERQKRADKDLVIARDRAEQAEAMLQDAVDSISEGIVIYDSEDRLVLCNEAYHSQFSDSTASMVPGARFGDILRSRLNTGEFLEAAGREEAWYDERMARHRQANATFEQKAPGDGWLLVTERRMRNGGTAGLSVSITALKRMQEALRESAARLDRAQEIAGVGSWELDLTTGQHTWSKQLYRTLHLSPDAFQPTKESAMAYVHPDDYRPVREWMADLHAGIQRAPQDIRILRADGTERLAILDGRPIADPEGVTRRLVGTVQDVTDRRLIEQQLVHAQKMEAIGNLTGGMAHDFNNVLGVIIGNLELQKRLIEDNAGAMELCGEALDAAGRCAGLIRRLLTFARQQSLHPEHTDVNTLIGNVLKLLGRTLGGHIELSMHLEPDLWPVVVDPVQLEAALVNLGTNARDAMPRGGLLDIATSNEHLDDRYAGQHPEVTPGDHVMIKISDTGAGIPREIIGRIFEPFFTTKEQGKGTGLGLAMIFGFIKQSGGHVAVYSEPGSGTIFRLYLPRDRTGVTEKPTAPDTSVTVGGFETVLVVEDNAELRWTAMQQLAVLGYQVRDAKNAEAALKLLATEGRVDLLFTDLAMPGDMDGLALAREVALLYAGTKVLLTSGFAGVNKAEEQLPISDYRVLDKPYQYDELARAVRAALDSREEASPSRDDRLAVGPHDADPRVHHDTAMGPA